MNHATPWQATATGKLQEAQTKAYARKFEFKRIYVMLCVVYCVKGLCTKVCTRERGHAFQLPLHLHLLGHMSVYAYDTCE